MAVAAGPAFASPCPMGSLLSGVSFKEPTTVEDCDSTWETDSEPEPPPEPAGDPRPLEGAGAAGGAAEEPPADGRPREPPGDAERAEADTASPEQVPPASLPPREGLGQASAAREPRGWRS